jgi:hypothetical protein
MARRVRVYDADGGGYVVVPADLSSKDEARMIYRALRELGFPRRLHVAVRPPVPLPEPDEDDPT